MKVYLGDSVYVDIENDMLKLTTENGYGPSNTIYLEREVIKALLLYIERRTTVRSKTVREATS